jgi:hypothetical protein
MAGTGKPIAKKLGIRGGQTVVVLNGPDGFERALTQGAPDSVRVYTALRLPPVDVVVLFLDRLADLEKRFHAICARLHPEGRLWVAWRKRRPTDVNEVDLRSIALAGGMIDTKSCEIDDVWSGVRLVVRVENRDALAYRSISPLRALREVRRTRRARPTSRTTAARARSSR